VLSGLSWLDRLLPVWIVLAMVLGVLIGSFLPQVMMLVCPCAQGPSSYLYGCSSSGGSTWNT